MTSRHPTTDAVSLCARALLRGLALSAPVGKNAVLVTLIPGYDAFDLAYAFVKAVGRKPTSFVALFSMMNQDAKWRRQLKGRTR